MAPASWFYFLAPGFQPSLLCVLCALCAESFSSNFLSQSPELAYVQECVLLGCPQSPEQPQEARRVVFGVRQLDAAFSLYGHGISCPLLLFSEFSVSLWPSALNPQGFLLPRVTPSTVKAAEYGP